MIIAVDVHYRRASARVAAVGFHDWRAAQAERVEILDMEIPGSYVPGEFYRRELPCLQRILQRFDLEATIECIIVDGFVELDEEGRMGLGAHLFQSLGESIPVIGVGKTPFRGMRPDPDDSAYYAALRRGKSRNPLYITAAGMPLAHAADRIRGMHGDYLMPTLLKALDRHTRSRDPDKSCDNESA